MNVSSTTRSSDDAGATARTGSPQALAFPLPRGERWMAARWFLVLGSIGVVSGGMVAAVSALFDSEPRSLPAQFPVFTMGVVGNALGAGLAAAQGS